MSNDFGPISLAGSALVETRHACACFNSDDDEYRVLLAFIGGILQRNPIYVSPQHLLPELRERRGKRVSSAAGI